MPPKLVIVQTCLPDYRLAFFERLVARRPETELVCGRDFFTPSLALCQEPAPWRSYLRNRFLFSRSLLWQSGLGRVVDSELVIAEFNPRVLSTWVLLVRRKLRGRRTLLWGHLWGQYGPVWLSHHFRLLMLRLSDGMITYNRSQAAEFSRLLPIRTAWVAPNSCVTQAMCIPHPAPRGNGCIVYVGRLIGSKKPAVLLEAFARAIPQLPPAAQLLFAGAGPEREMLERRTQELGLAGRVEMFGHVSSDADLEKIYRRAQVAVSPGYVGLSAIQCMAAGVPMLVSRHEPHSPEIEACQDGKTCEFFETDNIDDLAIKLVGFFRPDTPWRNARPAIAQFISQNYTIDRMIAGFDCAMAAGEVVSGPEGKVAVVWAQYGPYHLARLSALQERYVGRKILGVEIASRTSIYDWERPTTAESNLVTLLPASLAEESSILRIYRAALRLFLLQRVDVVFVTSYWPASSLAIILAARNAGCRIVMMNDSHALTAKAKGILAVIKRQLILSFDAALVGGKPHREYFISMGMDGRKILLGYDAVDNNYFERRTAEVKCRAAEVRMKHSLPERYFLNVGRMVWKKNLESLIDAYKVVKDRVGDECPSLVLVGSGKLERSLGERCLTHGLSVYLSTANIARPRPAAADVYFFGFRQVQELPEFYALASAFILPSREEEWGLVVNEAMASSLPVLVSRVSGCAQDLVRDGENGFVFDPFDVPTLAGHLEKIARRPELTVTMGAASLRIIREWGCDRFARAAQEAAEIALR